VNKHPFIRFFGAGYEGPDVESVPGFGHAIHNDLCPLTPLSNSME